MSDSPTLQLPEPSPPSPPRRGRRISRRTWAAIIIPIAIIALLIGADRVAAAYAANQIATRIQGYGFPVKPGVDVEGFPFLTQVARRQLDGIVVTAAKFPVGPVTASIDVRATGIALNSGYQSGTIAKVTGTGLIAFSGLASLAGISGAPGLKISRAGPRTVRLTLNLQILSASAIARVTKTGPNEFSIRVISASGVPLSLLGPIRHLTVHIPDLPDGLTVQAVTVTDQGVLVHITGSDIPFSS